MRNRPEHQKPALRSLTRVLALVTLAVGLLPATAALADGSSTTRPAAQIQSAPPATWSPVGTLDPQHVSLGNAQMIIYGAYLFTPVQVRFAPHAMPASLLQAIVPYVQNIGPGDHTYKLVFHLSPNTTTTHFQLDFRTPVEVAAGTTTLEFITDPGPGPVRAWRLTNADGDIWEFLSCDIYEKIN